MELSIFIKVILLGIALSMDAFAVSVTDGLIYDNLNKKRKIFISATFGIFQGLMPLIGYFIVELIENIVSAASAESAGKTMAFVVSWAACGLLVSIGVKMIIEAIKSMKEDNEIKECKKFSVKEVLWFGIATSIDALASGVALHSNISTNFTIFLHISIIMVITFVISLVGVLLGNKIEKLLRGKYEITCVIGGTILVLLAVWVILSYYLGI